MSSEENEKENKLEDFFNTIFSETVVTLFLWVLAIFVLMNSLINVSKQDGKNIYSKIADVVIYFIVFAYIFYGYYDISTEDREELSTYLRKQAKDFLKSSNSLLEVGILLLIIYGIGYLFTYITGDTKIPSSINAIMGVLLIVLLILITLFFTREILNIPIVDILFGSFGDLVSTDVEDTSDASNNETTDSNNNATKEEVYNVSNNLYSYDDAPYVCQALNGRLATYDEVERAYNGGAEWCNYGWSADQMALFPTQKATWEKLQTNEDFKHACGRPGINGGFISNPNIRYGVNCYGVKPAPTENEEKLMDARKDQLVPKSKKQKQIDRRVKFWRENASSLMNVNSFNKEKWSRY